MPLTPDIPDGASATTQRMLEGQRAFKAYDADTVTYTKCVDSAIDQLTREATGHASAADLNDLAAVGVRVHDTAIEQEQVAADSFNLQVRTFKAKHPK
ncbi:MAG: hypothetical protein JSR67_06955 [Proteobacteria bacterium]|nr:hypothetical protein [Pseudomonadota bacterium]